jgi:sulfite exporter TauE/SafE
VGRIAYNFGRIITYCALGIVFGLIGKTFLLAGFQRWVSIVLGIVLLIGLFTSRKLALWRPITAVVDRVKSAMGVLLRRRSADALLVLGLLNGLLPCGLVYVACAGATATGDFFDGAFYMLAFGVGTVPMMLAISLSGKLVPFSLRLKLARAIPVSVILLATLLILRGMSLGIPYVSPDLSSSASCCHK